MELVEEDEYDAIVVHGERLDGLAEGDWDRILSKKEIVFARTSPKNKLEIVTRFQNKGHIVGVPPTTRSPPSPTVARSPGTASTTVLPSKRPTLGSL